MISLAVHLLFAAAAPNSTAVAEGHGHPEARSFLDSPEAEVKSLADNVDNAIKVCTELSARAGARVTETGRAERLMVERGRLKWVDDAPLELKKLAEARHGTARIGRWFDPHAAIWIIAYERVATCRILVAGSPWTRSVRPALYAKIQDDNFWKAQDQEATFMSSMVRATFVADLPNSNVIPTISITAPVKHGDGVQLNIGVSLVTKEKN